MCRNQVEADVIVHSELSDPAREEAAAAAANQRKTDSRTGGGPSLSEDKYSPLSRISPAIEIGPREKLPLASLPSIKLVANHSGVLEDRGDEPTADIEPQQDMGLTNGFHSPKTVRPVFRSEHLEKGESRHCPSVAGKATSVGLPPAPFVSSGLVHSTSAAHSYLCP